MNNIEKDIAKIPAPRVVFEAKESLKRGGEVVMVRRAILWGSSVAAVVIFALHYLDIENTEITETLISQEVVIEPPCEVELVQAEQSVVSISTTATTPLPQQNKKAKESLPAAEPTLLSTPERIVKEKVGVSAIQYYAQSELPEVEIPTVQREVVPQGEPSRFKIDVVEMFKSNNNSPKPRWKDIKEKSRIFFREYLDNSILVASNK